MSYRGPRNAVSATIGDTIRALRMRGPMQTLREVARRTGISATHLSDIEHRNRRPSPALLTRLAKAMRAREVYAEEPCEACLGTGKHKRWTLEAKI